MRQQFPRVFSCFSCLRIMLDSNTSLIKISTHCMNCRLLPEYQVWVLQVASLLLFFFWYRISAHAVHWNVQLPAQHSHKEFLLHCSFLHWQFLHWVLFTPSTGTCTWFALDCRTFRFVLQSGGRRLSYCIFGSCECRMDAWFSTLTDSRA